MENLNEKNLNIKEIQRDLIISALEGGSNYWYEVTKHNKASKSAYLSEFIFDQEDGFIEIEADIKGQGQEPGKFLLNMNSVNKGWEIFKQYKIGYYTDAINENADAETGDIFLQICLFGEVIFG